MKEIIKLEEQFQELSNKYLSVLNNEIKHFDKDKTILIENYAFVLSKKILSILKEQYDVKIDVSIINDGIIQDMNKVILNYNNKYSSELINYTVLEDLVMDSSLENKTKYKKVNEYLNTIKKNYMMENNFLNNLNETFTKRILTRIMNTKPGITKEEMVKLANNIYVNVKNESFGFINDLNEKYMENQNRISTITKKINEAMAQLELLKPYKKLENEDEIEYTSRISRLKNIIENYDDEQEGEV